MHAMRTTRATLVLMRGHTCYKTIDWAQRAGQICLV